MIPWDAVFALHKVLLAIALATLGYGFILRRLAEVIHPLRLRLAELGEKYLEMPLAPEDRTQVIFYLDNAFNPWVAVVAVASFPFVIIFLLFRPKQNNTSIGTQKEIEYLFTISVVAANPLFSLVTALELLIAALFGVLLYKQLSLVKNAVHIFFQFKAVGWRRSVISARSA
jgi:hypothetical protein